MNELYFSNSHYIFLEKDKGLRFLHYRTDAGDEASDGEEDAGYRKK